MRGASKNNQLTSGIYGDNEHERKRWETRTRAVESQPFITRQEKFAGK